MANTVSLDQAQEFLNEPFTGPEPADETGLNSHFRSTFDGIPGHNSPTRTGKAPNPSSPLASHSRNASLEQKATSHTRKVSGGSATGGRSRGNSLNQRFPGDKTHHPLGMLKHDQLRAQRSPHIRKGSIPGIDQIDALDAVPGGRYHHEGPYDATLASRNQDRRHSPVAATFATNAQTLRATPPENVRNALDKHYPLDGVAQVAPGAVDRNGNPYSYEEEVMHTGVDGDYKKFDGEPLDDDHLEQIRNREETHRMADGNYVEADGRGTGIELAENLNKKHVAIQEHEIKDEAEGSSRNHGLEGLKQRIGSLRRKKD